MPRGESRSRHAASSSFTATASSSSRRRRARSRPVLASQHEIARLGFKERDAISRDIFGVPDVHQNNDYADIDVDVDADARSTWSTHSVTGHSSLDDNQSVNTTQSAPLTNTATKSTHSSSSILQTQLELGKASMDCAFFDLPLETKAARIEATVRCPQVVQYEARPEVFLTAVGLHAERAALKLANYWTARKELFGDQAFLPMTAYCALAADQTTLSTNVVEVLPSDECGRAVLYVDLSRLRQQRCASKLSDESVLRVLWYNVTNFILRERFSTTTDTTGFGATPSTAGTGANGGQVVQDVVLLFNFRDTDSINALNKSLLARMLHLLQDVLPIKIKALHVCGPSSNPTFLNDVVTILKSDDILDKQVRRRLILHGGQSPDKIAASLSEFGLAPESLPVPVGGSFAASSDGHEMSTGTQCSSSMRTRSAQAA